MRYRRLGNTDLKVSVIGFGSFATGKWLWGDDVEDDESIAAVNLALDSGINFIDTADVYGFGHAETVLAKALAGRPRESVILATKGGLVWDDKGNVSRDNSRRHLTEALDASLKRLRTDYVDLYQVHWPDPNTPVEETLEAMYGFWKAGKIRWIGVSNFDVPLMQASLKVAPVHCLQPQYNMFQRQIEQEILPFCQANGIGVIVYSPLAQGLLTGKFNRNSVFPSNDTRATNPLFQGDEFVKNLEIVERLRRFAGDRGKTVAQLAVAWTLARPGVHSALVGAKRPSQLAETIPGADWELTEAELKEIEDILACDPKAG